MYRKIKHCNGSIEALLNPPQEDSGVERTIVSLKAAKLSPEGITYTYKLVSLLQELSKSCNKEKHQ